MTWTRKPGDKELFLDRLLAEPRTTCPPVTLVELLLAMGEHVCEPLALAPEEISVQDVLVHLAVTGPLISLN